MPMHRTCRGCGGRVFPGQYCCGIFFDDIVADEMLEVEGEMEVMDGLRRGDVLEVLDGERREFIGEQRDEFGGGFGFQPDPYDPYI